MKPRLQEYYETRVVPRLAEELGLKNPMRVPRIEKIVVNVGLGEAPKNPKLLDSVVEELGQITGQKPVITRARKSISNFALREGMAIGAMVTLRGAHMYEFLDRLINVVTPRLRDFRGLKSKLDGRGNYSMGIAEQSVFPEIEGALLEKQQGMNITLTVSGGRDDWSRALLEEMNFPFRTEKEGR